MIGITSYGSYLPRYRMERSVILQQMGWFNPGSPKGDKAVVNCDEDSITMAYAAANNCLIGKNSDDIDGVYLASLSFPFSVRQNSVVVAKALNLRDNIRSSDYTSSLQCGTNALLSAIETVAANNDSQIVTCATDARRAKPGSPQEYTWGDGAAAFCIGNKGVVASFIGEYSLGCDFIDKKMIDTEEFERSWEDRWTRDEGYMKIIPKAIKGLLDKLGTDIPSFAKVCIACPNTSALKAVGKLLRFTPNQEVDNLITAVGDTGSAMSYLMLISVLENANAGDKIMLVSFGYGAQALAFEVTPEIDKVKSSLRGVSYMLNRKAPLKDYTRYLAYKNLIQFEMGIRGETIPPSSMSLIWKQSKAMAALEGVRCKVCGTPQFPKHTVCVNPECNATGQMEPYLFSDKIGKIVSFTADSLAFSWDPPQLYGLVDFAEGGRIFLDITDCAKESIKVGTQVEMTFRRKYIDNTRGHYCYFWKAMPVL